VASTKPRSRIGHAATALLVTALALTVGGVVFALGVGVAVEDTSGEQSFWTFAACDVVLIVVALIVRSHARAPRAGPRRRTVAENHACGSCGRRFDSRQELRAHREAVHAPGLALRPPKRAV
jgi:hypothetical protein